MTGDQIYDLAKNAIILGCVLIGLGLVLWHIRKS